MLGVPPPATVLIIIIKNCYYFGAMRCDAGGRTPLISYSVHILRICIPCVRQRLFGLFPICVRILNIYLLPLV